MKTILVIFALLFAHQSIAVAPYGIKGQNQTQTLYSNVHQFPEKSVVNIGGINALVYSSGIIYDGGFESATALDGWACTGNAFMTIESKPVDAATIIEGNKTLRIACNNLAGCFCSQDIPINQQQIGRSVLLSGAVRTTSDKQGLTVIYRENGADTSITSAQVFNGIASTEAVVGSSATSIGIKFTVPYSASPINVRLDSMKLEYGTAVTNQPAIGPRVAYTPTFTGFGVVSNVNCYGQQVGANEIVECTFTSGTSTAVEARVSLRNGITAISSLPTISIVGTGTVSVTATFVNSVLIEQNAAYITFGAMAASNAGLTKLNANTFISNGQKFSFKAIVPIAQYASSVPTYTGRCSDRRKCSVNMYLEVVSSTAGKFSTGLPWATCSKVATGTYDCDVTILGNSLPMVCQPSSLGYTRRAVVVPANTTSTNVRVNVFDSTAETDEDGNFSLNCSRQLVDADNAQTLQQSVALKNYPEMAVTQGRAKRIKFRFGSGANCTGDCTTGTCAICGPVLGTYTNVTYAGSTGAYNINGVKDTYECTGQGASGISVAFIRSVFPQPATTYHRFVIYDTSGNNVNGRGTVECDGYE